MRFHSEERDIDQYQVIPKLRTRNDTENTEQCQQLVPCNGNTKKDSTKKKNKFYLFFYYFLRVRIIDT